MPRSAAYSYDHDLEAAASGVDVEQIATVLQTSYVICELTMHGPQQTVQITRETSGIDPAVAESLERVGQIGEFWLVAPEFQHLFRRYVARARREIIDEGVYVHGQYLVPREGTDPDGRPYPKALTLIGRIAQHASDLRDMLAKLARPQAENDADPTFSAKERHPTPALSVLYDRRVEAVEAHATAVADRIGASAGQHVRAYLLPRLATVDQMQSAGFTVQVRALTLRIETRDHLDRLIAESLRQDSLTISKDIVKRLADELCSAFDSLLRDGLDILNIPDRTRERCQRISHRARDHNLLADPKIAEATDLLEAIVTPRLGDSIPDVTELHAMRSTLGAMTDLFAALPAFDFTRMAAVTPPSPDGHDLGTGPAALLPGAAIGNQVDLREL